MTEAFIQLGLFTAKATIIVLFILIVLVIFFALLRQGKEKTKGKISIKNINQQYAETKEYLLSEILTKKLFKHFLKEKKQAHKIEEKKADKKPHTYVLNFEGDIKASAVSALREEITAIIHIASPGDEVVLRLESPGGMVPHYGLAAAQLMRLRAHNIKLTVAVDKVAASGGYLMASVANKIIAAPFAIVGSIGVIVQLPNFHRLLKEKQIDFEQQTAGEFKRTITMFGENTDEGREKLQHEIEDIHQQFKNLITEYRTQIDIKKVATGEHWLAKQAIDLQLVDELKTSDDYLMERSKDSTLFEISYEIKKPLLAKLLNPASSALREKLFKAI